MTFAILVGEQDLVADYVFLIERSDTQQTIIEIPKPSSPGISLKSSGR